MHGWSTPVKRGQLLLFWGVIAAVLIVSAGQIRRAHGSVPRRRRPVVISEFMAVNDAARWTKTDPSDWIEL
ncbi:MAG: hypothetical protein R2851_11975 [Caldilineaceae bacterium]